MKRVVLTGNGLSVAQEEVNLENSRVLRIGVLCAEYVQLCYMIKK